MDKGYGEQYALNSNKAEYDIELEKAKSRLDAIEDKESTEYMRAQGYYEGLQAGWSEGINPRI